MLIFILQFTATLPHIYHHPILPIYKDFRVDWWQSGSKFHKNLFRRITEEALLI